MHMDLLQNNQIFVLLIISVIIPSFVFRAVLEMDLQMRCDLVRCFYRSNKSATAALRMYKKEKKLKIIHAIEVQ